MRILAIRGENLASLYGPFDLPLDAGPIAEAGLFSISGPTGSGKSTLMDALCLALFGKTPRLGERGRGVMVGREGDDPALRIDANDERDLISRGTGGGFAEVDFEGVDSKRYRSRWSAHRARGQAGGKFQAVRVKVEEIGSGDVLAGTVRERDELVPRLLGYSFEEFRRAVVLPQFEFTAFLKASAAVRADILERVTGTDVYTRLSIAAFRRSSVEVSKLEDLDRRAGEIRLLGDVERAGLLENAAALASQEDEARKRAGAAASAIRWHETDERNRMEVASAEEAVLRARADDDAAKATRVELRRVEQAEALRGLHDDSERTLRELTLARERDGRSADQAREAESASGAADLEATGASALLAEVEERSAAMRPQLEEARHLDLLVRESQGRLDDAAAVRRKLDDAAALARSSSDEAARAVAGLEAARDGAASWLAAHASDAGLAAEWSRWEALLRKHATFVTDIARTQESACAAGERKTAALSARDLAASKVASLDRAFGALEEAARAAEATAAGDNLTALRRAQSSAAEAHGFLKDLARLATDAATARRDLEEAEKEIEEAEAQEHAAAAELAALEKKVIGAEAALEADRESLARTQEALSLEEHRDRLEDGVPCPVCGATEHPFARKAPTETLEKKQKGVVASREKELKSLQQESTAAGKRATRADARAEKGRTQRDKHASALQAATNAHGVLRERAALPGVPVRPTTGLEKLQGLLEAAGAALTQAQGAVDGAVVRKEKAEAARREVEARRKEVEDERKALRVAEQGLDLATAALRKAEEDVRSLVIQRDGAEAELDTPLTHLGDWRPRVRTDGIAFHRSCAQVVADHSERRQALDGAEKALGPARAAFAGAQVTAEEKTQAVEEAIRREETVTRELEGRRTIRTGLLGGRPAADVEAEHVAAATSARKRVEATRRLADSARVGLARATQERSDAAARLSASVAEEESSRRRLSAALAEAGLDAAEFASLLSRGQAWIEETRRSLLAIAQALTEATSTHADRVRRADAHAREDRPTVSREEAALEFAAAGQAEAIAKSSLTEVQFRLRADEEGRAQAMSLSVERVAQQGVATRWRALSDLIGSSDGKKFRSFAQGLTLDALLRQANHHLVDLAPRYRLMRVPGQDLELQVIDKDLGDEVRSVNGLSGGESFLVSLALALALASVATRVSHSRTLFIDEGFGTLDRETLEHAMVALDSLRASGRTVGVISHVPELHERIGVRVDVERTGVGRSEVRVPT